MSAKYGAEQPSPIPILPGVMRMLQGAALTGTGSGGCVFGLAIMGLAFTAIFVVGSVLVAAIIVRGVWELATGGADPAD